VAHALREVFLLPRRFPLAVKMRSFVITEMSAPLSFPASTDRQTSAFCHHLKHIKPVLPYNQAEKRYSFSVFDHKRQKTDPYILELIRDAPGFPYQSFKVCWERPTDLCVLHSAKKGPGGFCSHSPYCDCWTRLVLP